MADVQHYRRYEEVPSDITCQIASFVRLVWLADLKGEDRFWKLDDPTGVRQYFVIVERSVLISHANVITRTITHAAESYLLYGLGGVFTYPAFRGEGYGQQVVDAATAYIRRSPADIGMLFCDPARWNFYGRSGWSRLKTEILVGTLEQRQPFTEEPVMIIYNSARAKAHQNDFETQPIYVGEDTW
jgi:GNAT superfamily N-acetyltransferase